MLSVSQPHGHHTVVFANSVNVIHAARCRLIVEILPAQERFQQLAFILHRDSEFSYVWRADYGFRLVRDSRIGLLMETDSFYNFPGITHERRA